MQTIELSMEYIRVFVAPSYRQFGSARELHGEQPTVRNLSSQHASRFDQVAKASRSSQDL
jgi:hypothetical protein